MGMYAHYITQLLRLHVFTPSAYVDALNSYGISGCPSVGSHARNCVETVAHVAKLSITRLICVVF